MAYTGLQAVTGQNMAISAHHRGQGAIFSTNGGNFYSFGGGHS